MPQQEVPGASALINSQRLNTIHCGLGLLTLQDTAVNQAETGLSVRS